MKFRGSTTFSGHMTERLPVTYRITDPMQAIGFTKPAPGRVLMNAAAKVPLGMAIVEIGVYHGRSTLFLAQGSAAGNRAMVHAVDPWDLPGERYPFAWTAEKRHRSTFTLKETRLSAEANVKDSPWRDLVVLYTAFSVDLAKKWDPEYRVALLHVDGLHTEEGVNGDLAAWAPHLAIGATICFDDFVPNCQPVIDVALRWANAGRITTPKLAKGCRRLAVARWVG